MNESRFEFPNVTALTVGAIGAPGHRTFYLLLGKEDQWVRLWLEKEQVQSLSLAIEQLLALLAKRPGQASVESAKPPADPPLLGEFKVGRLSLGYDEGREMAVLYAYEAEAGEEGPPTLTCWASLEQMRALSQDGETIAAAGRPVCRLCGQSIDPEGHICPRLNGHRHTVLREDQQS